MKTGIQITIITRSKHVSTLCISALRSLSLSLSLSLFLSIQGTVLKSLYLNFSNIHVRFRYPHKHVAAGTVPAENKRTELKWYPTDSSNCSMQTIIWFSLPTKFAIYLFYNANSNSIHISTFPTASIDDGALVPYCRLSCTTQIIKSNHVKMTVSDKLKKIKINKKSSKYVGIWAGCLHNGSTWFCSNIRSHVAIPAGTSLAPRVVYNLFVQWNNPARVQATPQAIIDITDNAHLGFQTVIVSFSLLLLSDLENR